jgi:hypothetical protein
MNRHEIEAVIPLTPSRKFVVGSHRRGSQKYLVALVVSVALNVTLMIVLVAHSTHFAQVELKKVKTSVMEEITHTTTSTPTESSTAPPLIPVKHGQPIRYPKIFGHLHYAKTAGTEINGELAAHFERVCGHKGYSHDAYQLHVRQEAQLADNNNTTNNQALSTTGFVSEAQTLGGNDSISKAFPTFNRGRVPEKIMFERGFEDCDWISLESPWELWSTVLPDYPIELHVPCRDPIEHLMSQCNHKRKIFDCGATNLQKEVNGCLLGWIRFDSDLRHDAHLSLKCFDPTPIHPYLEYIGQFLERKRIETDYIHRSTNPPRNKTNECIWQRPDMHQRVTGVLKRLEYYRFCEECMGSENDLLA